jgi:TPP-dependent indolepyruvate ferredoxin oxidoreductase alpha subunit
VQRGIANTRWRDYADVYLLSGRHRVDGDEVRESVRRVATYRSAPLSELSVVLAGYSNIAQSKWAAWVRKQDLSERLPFTFEEVAGRGAEVRRSINGRRSADWTVGT